MVELKQLSKNSFRTSNTDYCRDRASIALTATLPNGKLQSKLLSILLYWLYCLS